jgi:hypothetical protein
MPKQQQHYLHILPLDRSDSFNFSKISQQTVMYMKTDITCWIPQYIITVTMLALSMSEK